MLASEVELYIRHRLSLVGWQDNPHFTGDAFAAIYAATDGVPRRINALMSRVMLLGAVDHLTTIDARAVEAVAADMGLGEAEGGSAVPAVETEPMHEVHVADSEITEVEALTVVDAEEAVEFAGDIEPEQHAAAPLELHRIREELDELRRVINLSGDRASQQRVLANRLDAIETRVNGLEARSDEQEAALRRVLNMLVDWVEQDHNEVRAA
jgi:general secretion pathway protein A